MKTLLVVIIVILLVVIFLPISIYNKLVRMRNRVRNAFSQIDVQLKRRHDLIPNLVETAKSYMSYEKDTLEAVIEARNKAVTATSTAEKDPANAESIKNLSNAESQLSGALGRMFALSEAYPDLKANENMMQLSEELTSTENKVAFSRQAYNDAVLGYNNARETFPSNICANLFGFRYAESFEIESEDHRETPEVKF